MAIVSFAKWLPVVNHSGAMSSHNGLVLHVQAGNGSCYNLFNNPAYQASSTFWCGKDGTLEQYVDTDETAWAQSAGNSTWNSVETEGFPEEPLTDAQIKTLGKLYNWGMTNYNWPAQLTDDPNGRGFGWHGMGGAAWGGHTSCPGDIRKDQRQAILDIAKGGNTPPSPAPTKETDMAVSQVITNFKPSQQDVFQTNSGNLYHKWRDSTGKWNNEMISGPSGGVTKVAASYPDQVPQVTVSGNQVLVTVEDSRGFVFYFAQGATGGWGVNQLP